MSASWSGFWGQGFGARALETGLWGFGAGASGPRPRESTWKDIVPLGHCPKRGRQTFKGTLIERVLVRETSKGIEAIKEKLDRGDGMLAH